MNLLMYDPIDEKVDKQKTWVYPNKKCLFSRELKYYKYYYLAKRYDNNNDCTNYFLIFVNNQVNNICKLTKIDNFGRLSVNISKIWKYTILKNITKPENINIDLVEYDKNQIVYYLDI